MYIKVFDADDVLIGAEEISEPVYIRWQTSNGLQVRCKECEAQGILSADENMIYLYNGFMPFGLKRSYAVQIEKNEYDALDSVDSKKKGV